MPRLVAEDLLSARVRRWIVQTVVRREEAIENRHMVVLMHLLLYWETESVQRLLSARIDIVQPFLREDVAEMTAENIGCRRELLETVELLEPVNLTDFWTITFVLLPLESP